MTSDIPPAFLQAWNDLDPKAKEAFRKFTHAVDMGSVKLETDGKDVGEIKYQSNSPFLSLPPEYANTVQVINPRLDRMEQVEAVVEIITRIQQGCFPRGLVLNKEKASGAAGLPTRLHIPQGFEMTKSVLGKGNSAGEVVVVKDCKSNQDLALKTISVSQFNKDEIYLWLHLGEADMAPELYHFELKDNKVYFTMEVMTGKSLQSIMDDKMMTMQAEDPELARSFSLCVLYDLLKIQEKMREKNFSHCDIHGGNIQLEHTMNMKIFDFGQARNLLNKDDQKRLVKNDVINLIRMFCCLYSGFDFNDSFEALKILTARSLDDLNPFMLRIPEEHRKEMYTIMNDLFDTVRDLSSEGYGDTTEVASDVQALIKEDIDEIKKRAAVIIFPEKFQHAVIQCDGVDGCESESEPIWDDENMEDFVDNVTNEKLKAMGIYLSSG